MITVNLKNLLESRGINQSELARLTGIRPSTICGIYHNSCAFLKVEHINKICSALSCTPAELISFSGGDSE